jgi:hypothetical protein
MYLQAFAAFLQKQSVIFLNCALYVGKERNLETQSCVFLLVNRINIFLFAVIKVLAKNEED